MRRLPRSTDRSCRRTWRAGAFHAESVARTNVTDSSHSHSPINSARRQRRLSVAGLGRLSPTSESADSSTSRHAHQVSPFTLLMQTLESRVPFSGYTARYDTQGVKLTEGGLKC